MKNIEKDIGGPEKSPRQDIQFKGEERDSLSNDSAQEFYEIAEHWDEFDNPVQQLDRWCNHYYGRKQVPINFALKLWKNESCRDAAWLYVKEEFQNYLDKLGEHGASSEIIEDIKRKLETPEK